MTLFRVRYDTDGHDERKEFLNSRDFSWIQASPLFARHSLILLTLCYSQVNEKEKSDLATQLAAATPALDINTQDFYKVHRTCTLHSLSLLIADAGSMDTSA